MVSVCPHQPSQVLWLQCTCRTVPWTTVKPLRPAWSLCQEIGTTHWADWVISSIVNNFKISTAGEIEVRRWPAHYPARCHCGRLNRCGETSIIKFKMIYLNNGRRHLRFSQEIFKMFLLFKANYNHLHSPHEW